MATLIGQAGNFQADCAYKRRERAFLILFLGTCVIMFLTGYSTAKKNGLWAIVAMLFCVLLYKFIGRLFDDQIRTARAEENGASGEREILPFLKRLPDTFTVVCDLDFAESYGNIDHLVIGPTGVFSIDVKNWKGSVASDGKGELLVNGKPTDKPHVRGFIARTMDLKNRIKALTKLDPYVQCLFVFPHTHLQANWGTTGAVHCIHADQLEDYITKGKGGKPLAATDISMLVKAVEALRNVGGTDSKA